jgi:hypothetical protein
MPTLLLLFVMKYQQRSFLRLIPMVVYMLKLIPMGVTVHQLIPMGVTLLKLNPMGVIVLKLIPMGVTVLKLIPMGVTVHRPLFRIFYEDKEEEEEVPLIRKNSRCYRGSRGIVIFLLQLCLLLSAFKNCP